MLAFNGWKLSGLFLNFLCLYLHFKKVHIRFTFRRINACSKVVFYIRKIEEWPQIENSCWKLVWGTLWYIYSEPCTLRSSHNALFGTWNFALSEYSLCEFIQLVRIFTKYTQCFSFALVEFHTNEIRIMQGLGVP